MAPTTKRAKGVRTMSHRRFCPLQVEPGARRPLEDACELVGTQAAMLYGQAKLQHSVLSAFGADAEDRA